MNTQEFNTNLDYISYNYGNKIVNYIHSKLRFNIIVH